MSADVPELTPQQRLAVSRRALLHHLQGRDANGLPDPKHHRPAAASGLLSAMPWGTMARNVVGRWWSRHPANAVGQLARPILQRYADEQPVKLMAGAAAVGALLVLVKPWRLLSAGALAAALLKTSNVAGMVTSLMESKDKPRKDPHG